MNANDIVYHLNKLSYTPSRVATLLCSCTQMDWVRHKNNQWSGMREMARRHYGFNID